jgi:hypothetical protein
MSQALRILLTCLSLLVLAAASATAQPVFSADDYDCSASLTVTTNTTLPLPSDGIVCFATFVLEAGATLSFTRNAANTPVYLLATGEIRIDGVIAMAGERGLSTNGALGGPGGFTGGNAGYDDREAPSAGRGPGGGLPDIGETYWAGRGVFGSGPSWISSIDGQIYGSPLLIPLIGGSGGGGRLNPESYGGGGGGGGAILLASNTRIEITGSINVRGGYDDRYYNGGSGGAVRVVAPSVAGNGSLAAGPYGNNLRYGGQGRTRVDLLDDSEMNLVSEGVHTVGTFLSIFPENLARLYITHAAGTDIAPGTRGPVTILLPAGAASEQTVTLAAENFSGTVEIEVVVTPDRGNPVVYPVELVTASGVGEVDVVVEVPNDVVTRIHAWVR